MKSKAVDMDSFQVFQSDGTLVDRNIPDKLDEDGGIYVEVRKTPVVVTKMQEAMSVTFFCKKESRSVSFLAVNGQIVMKFDGKETVIFEDADISSTESFEK